MIILYLCATKGKGGKEDAHYVPDQSYQRLSNCGYQIGEIAKEIGTDQKNDTEILVTEGFFLRTAYPSGEPSI